MVFSLEIFSDQKLVMIPCLYSILTTYPSRPRFIPVVDLKILNFHDVVITSSHSVASHVLHVLVTLHHTIDPIIGKHFHTTFPWCILVCCLRHTRPCRKPHTTCGTLYVCILILRVKRAVLDSHYIGPSLNVCVHTCIHTNIPISVQ